jgi:hypothetical protein
VNSNSSDLIGLNDTIGREGVEFYRTSNSRATRSVVEGPVFRGFVGKRLRAFQFICVILVIQ